MELLCTLLYCPWIWLADWVVCVSLHDVMITNRSEKVDGVVEDGGSYDADDSERIVANSVDDNGNHKEFY